MEDGMERGSLFNLNESAASEDRYSSDEQVSSSDDVGRIRTALGPKLVHSHSPEELERKWRFRKELISLSLTVLLVLMIVGGLLVYARMEGITLTKAIDFVRSIGASDTPAATAEIPPVAEPVKKKATRSRGASTSKRAPFEGSGAAAAPARPAEVEPQPRLGRMVQPLLVAQVIDARQRRILEGDNPRSRITVDWSRQEPLWSGNSRAAYIPAAEFRSNEASVSNSMREPQSVNVRQGGGQLVHQVMPSYPATALQERIQGAVVMQATVGKDGTVSSVQPVSGPPLLVVAAVDAVRQWRYAPYMHEGQPEAFTAEITVDFALSNNGK
jgi:TonB family protein